jgi:hypothetical protein
MATWDDLTGTWDQLWTWDDPDRNMDIDAQMASGSVTMGAPGLTVDWIGDVPTDLIAPTPARDEFPVTILASDSFSRSVASGVGATDQGTIYTTSGGSASDYNVNGSALVLTLSSLNVDRAVVLPITAFNSEMTVTFGCNFVPTGAGGVIEQGYRARYVDASNFVAFRIFRTVNTGAITLFVRQVVGGVATESSVGNFTSVPINASITIRFRVIGTALYAWANVTGSPVPTTPTASLTGVTHVTAGPSQVYSFASSAITNALTMTTTVDDLLLLNGDMKTTSADGHVWAPMFFNSFNRISRFDGYGTFRPDSVNTIAFALVDDIVEADFDVTVKVRATSLFTGARGAFIIVARVQDTSNYYRFRFDFNTDQVMGYAFEVVSGGSVATPYSGLFPEIFHDVAKWLRFRVQGIGSVIRMKAWDDAEAPPKEWTTIWSETGFATAAGKCGFGGYLAAGNTNPLPYIEFEVAEYFQGSNSPLDGGQISVGLSLDDGMPSEVTNTQNIGVNEATGDLLGPIGISPDIYFSTFRSDMPYADLPRDVAGVTITAQVLGANGLRSVRAFTGRMADIPLDDQSAKLEAISASRLALSAPVQPPAVHGFYEGREATWLIGYALFASGLYVAPRPIDGCRLYLPLNGTTHPYIPATNYGAAGLTGMFYSAVNNAAFRAPNWIDGPFTAAPDLCINATDTRTLRDGPGVFYTAGFAPGADFLSQAGYRGRIEAWVKLDSAAITGSKSPGQSALFRIRLRNPGTTRYASLEISPTRKLQATMADGTNSALYVWGDLPSDEAWHFIALSWEVGPSGPLVKVTFDNSSFFYGGLTYANLPATDDLERVEFDICLPTVEVRLTSGSLAFKASMANQIIFTPDVVMRRSILSLEAIAEPAPREAFELLSSLAQGELAQIGFDASDRFQYLPLPYWAEPEQQLVVEALSTDTNLGKRFRPTSDVHKIYNQITLQYSQTYVNETWVTGFQSSQLIRLDPGVSIDLVAPMSTPIVEVRGLTFSVLSGSALAATPPSVTNAINYITLNTAQDGTGSYAASTDARASVISWNPGAVTIRITNNSTNIYFLSNNVSIPPLGLGVKQAVSLEAYVQASNTASIARRNVRNLSVTLSMVQRGDNALTIAQTLASFLSKARTALTSDVWADFRRKPGSLVLVQDIDGTGINTTFRLTGITTSQDGANVQQAIAAVQAWTVQDWGSGTWGSGIWGH